MKKLLILFVGLIMFLAACGSEEKTLIGAVEYFEEQGFEIGEKSEQYYQMIGASDGFSIELNGESIELYSYESNSDDLKEIQANGEYDMEGFVIPAKANGNIVMMAYDEHSEADSIIETFNSY